MPSLQEGEGCTPLLKPKIRHRYLLKGVLDVFEGARMPWARYTDLEIQNEFYEGYNCSVDVNNLFVKTFYGELVLAAFNYPDDCHDSKLAHKSGRFISVLVII